MAEDHPSQNNPPTKRKPRFASFVVCALTAAGIIYYAFREKTTIKYQADNDNCAIRSDAIEKGISTCYTKKEKETYPVFLSLGFGLLGIMLGTVVDRLCLVFEELCQFQSRYGGDISKLFKSCFSGVSWLAVFLVFLLIVVSVSLGRKTSYQVADIIYVLGGIGVGPFVIHLLNLNTMSEVHLSRILEERDLYPGYILAWSYYFNHVEPAAERLKDGIVDREESRPYTTKLSLDKLILLQPSSTIMTDINKLIRHDRRIQKLARFDVWNPYPFAIYYFKDHKKYFAMECIKEPIVALNRIKFVTDETYKDEKKRFYDTLCKILKNPPDDTYAKKGIVIPITVEAGNEENLNDGKLAEIIIAEIYRLNSDDTKDKKGKTGKKGSREKNKGKHPEKEPMLAKSDDELENDDDNGASTSGTMPNQNTFKASTVGDLDHHTYT